MTWLQIVLSLIGGLSLFLFGMRLMSEGLERRAGDRMREILARMTSGRVRGLLLGIAVTAAIQSSSAVTVMVVGFVNSGLLTLHQSIAVIMGANIGTTVTAWILSLTGIEGDSFFLTLLKPSSFAPILALFGVCFYLFSKKEERKSTGAILLGFTVLIFGMEKMSDAVAPLSELPEFGRVLLLFENPIFGILAGAILTAIIQSSSASVGILQVLSTTGELSFAAVIPIVMGQNIGTCTTSLISSIGTNINARRATMVHLYFNLIGTIVILAGFYFGNLIFQFPFMEAAVTPFSIASVHTVFNLISTALLLPFASSLERLVIMTVRGRKHRV